MPVDTLTDAWEVRHAETADAPELAALLNAVIAAGGTTALEDPFTPEAFDRAFVTGPDVHCCFVALDPATRRIEGFQALCRYPSHRDEIGDIGTFARPGGTRRGIGTALFAATRDRGRALGLLAINATIRADNAGGLVFYGRLGFVDHDRLVGVALKDGRRVDRVVKRFALLTGSD